MNVKRYTRNIEKEREKSQPFSEKFSTFVWGTYEIGHDGKDTHGLPIYGPMSVATKHRLSEMPIVHSRDLPSYNEIETKLIKRLR